MIIPPPPLAPVPDANPAGLTGIDGASARAPRLAAPGTVFARYAEMLLRPDLFFQQVHPPLTNLEKMAIASLIGVAAALGNLESQAKELNGARIVGALLGGCLFGSFVAWFFGRLMMRVQIVLSGGTWKQDETVFTYVFAYSSALSSIPLLVMNVVSLAAGPDSGLLRFDIYVFLMMGLAWGAYVRFVAFRTCFATKRWRTWFWVVGFYLAIFGGAIGYGFWTGLRGQ